MTDKKARRFNLTTWILISLVAGIVVGLACSYLIPAGSPADDVFIEGICYVCGQWFVRLMQMLVVPLVFCSIVCGAASMSDPKMLGKVGIGTIAIYLLTTALAVIIAIMLAEVCKPGMGLDMAAVVAVEPTTTTTEQTFADMLINIIPKNIVASMNNGDMLPIIFFALMLGFILGRLGKKVATVNRFFTQFNAIMMKMIGVILRVAPIGIFCLITRTFCNLGVSGVLPMVEFIGTVYLGLAVQLLVVYMLILFIGTRLNPFHFLRKFWPVMAFAFSTSSSNATIPLNMETLEKKMGVDNRVASFTIPLGATINMDGTAIMQGAAVVFIAQAFGIDLSIALAMVFDSIGLPAEGVAMIMGIDRLLDMGRTAINITGDAVVTTVMANFVGLLDKDVYRNRDFGAIDEADLEAPSDPIDYDEFTEHGDPTEVGEQGEPDRFKDMEYPTVGKEDDHE